MLYILYYITWGCFIMLFTYPEELINSSKEVIEYGYKNDTLNMSAIDKNRFKICNCKYSEKEKWKHGAYKKWFLLALCAISSEEGYTKNVKLSACIEVILNIWRFLLP